MKDVKVVLKHVTKLWLRWGWTDHDDASLIASRIISEDRLTTKSLNELPDSFFTFNRISRVKLLQALKGLNLPDDAVVSKDHVDILLLTASPEFVQDRLRVDREYRDIVKRIRASTKRDQLNFHVLPAAEPTDIIDELNRVKPTILQISSHGDVDGIILEGASIYDGVLSATLLKKIVATTSSHVKIVILNSCHSYQQAEALTEHVDIAIGMSQAIGDKSATAFSGQFYSSLAEGNSVQVAFDQALIHMAIIKSQYTDVPRLYAAKGVKLTSYKIC